MIKNLDNLESFRPYLLPNARITRRDWFRVLGKLRQDENGCILWMGGRTKGGYGVISMIRNRKKSAVRVTRLIYEICHNVDIPEGMQVCHECDNPPCLNPDHLWLGTHLDNTHDKMEKGRCRNGSKKGEVRTFKLNHEARAFILDQNKNKTRETALILSKKYNVTRETIYNLWKGITWKTSYGTKKNGPFQN